MKCLMQATNPLSLNMPVIQAPMAGGATTPALVAAVSNMGGLGSLGAGYWSPDAIKEAIKKTRKLTDKPFAVNLFIPEKNSVLPAASAMHAAIQSLQQACVDIDVVTEPVEPPFAENFDEQMHVLLEEKVAVFSFTFGLLSPDWITALKHNKTYLIGTATTVSEARALIATGVDAIVLQGLEAGGHRGSFEGAAETRLMPLYHLLEQYKDLDARVPFIASGGIADGRAMGDVMQRGATYVQIGTAFLTTDESGIHPAYKARLLELTRDETVLTKVFSGKLARGVENRFTQNMQRINAEILAYPAQNALTKLLRNYAKDTNNPEYMSMWAGQSAHLCQKCSVKAFMEQLMQDMAGNLEWRAAEE
ncbi:MAG: nitronate monooxygenase [Legionellaceae bacterium]|nr:nitronate monooxygenase [Legionellaceae bacterium]